MSAMQPDKLGWELLNHGGLLVDAPRLRELVERAPDPLPAYVAEEWRRRFVAFHEDRARTGEWVAWVLERVCGFAPGTGTWQRGNQLGTEWSRTSLTGEVVRPRQVWRGSPAGVLPVFVDDEHPQLGKGRGRKAVSNVLQWMRASNTRLALLTNGRQWRLLHAGLDADAFCEWDAERWFEEGGLGLQVNSLRLLLQPALWTQPGADQPAPLLQAVQDSRKGQAELSALLGERVREAVELLVQAHGEQLKQHCADVDPADIYRAAVRVVMRMVVVFFAESRDLLPRSSSLYHRAYGLNGLLEELEKHGGKDGARLKLAYGAWPRVLALFRLVYQGSPHPALPIHAYGGELFEAGDAAGTDGLKRALAVFESACYQHQVMSDRDVRTLLERISRTKVKVRQGRGATWMPAPVDFADLSSEYIGILYEGLLDFELKTADDDPVIFLAVGKEPALPLKRLQDMSDAQLKSLLQSMKDTSQKGDADDEEDDEGADEAGTSEDAPVASTHGVDPEGADEDDTTPDAEEEVTTEENAADQRHSTRTRAEEWARRVVQVAGLVKKPKGTLTPEKRAAHEREIAQKAKALVRRVVLPGEWFLVRWGGTRKGAGTFYTRPGLAVPTVHRTLRPLAYDAPVGADGQPDTLAPAAQWTPKKPEEILALKVCDPACGSGSFPVAALRFLTEAVYTSLHHHGRINAQEDRALVALLQDRPGAPETLGTELIPARPDDETFEARLKARLRRHVVERCIYGVDLDPLAVELCRLALWVETMDRDLPFSFLDHKIKCGNGLVGAWFDQFQHYPVMAWKNREAGDKNHTNGVHYQKEARTKAIKQWVKDVLTPDLRTFLQGRTLFAEDLQGAAANAHEDALDVLNRLHDLPVHDSAERARIYRTELLGSYAYQRLKAAMDLWCACWFWPADALAHAPLPSTLAEPPEATKRLATAIAQRKRFFHWELEFPDVFRKAGDGFDAMIGNPPWENLQPNPEEYFANFDPLFRTYGRLEKRAYLQGYFGSDIEGERLWLEYSADFNSFSNWVSYASMPFGDPERSSDSKHRFNIGSGNEQAHMRWRNARARASSYSDSPHSYQYQTGRIFTYKLFLEQCHSLLRVGGRFGQIIPSGIYSDAWSMALRQLFIDKCTWEWLFGFENRNSIFAIHKSFKFNPIIVSKGGSTRSIYTAFMRRNLEDWERAEELAISYRREQIDQFSPTSLAILEIQSQRDIEVLEKLYDKGVLLGAQGPDGWGVKYQLEFMMNTDAALFPPRPKWEEKGFQPDEYSRWLLGKWRRIAELWHELNVKPLAEGERRMAQPPYDTLPIPRVDIPAGIILSRDATHWIREEEVEDVALPLYEGRMIGQFDFSQKGWVSGKGRSAVWKDIPWEQKVIEPQFLMAKLDYLANSHCMYYPKLAHMRVGSATNSRSAAACPVSLVPTSDTTAIFYKHSWRFAASLAGVFNSFVFDYITRKRLVGLHLDHHVFAQNPLPGNWSDEKSVDHQLSLALASPGVNQALSWYPNLVEEPDGFAWRKCWALTSHERARVAAGMDAIAFAQYGLDMKDANYILLECDLPLGEASPARNNPKGFWRIDKDKDPELRHTVLTLVAFHDLQQKITACGGDRDKGIEAFLSQNNGEGWLLPETLRLADYGLGHDERANEHQPVASGMGPRFYDWQLAQTPEESWKECHLHARNLLGAEGYAQLLQRIEAEKRGEVWQPPSVVEEPEAEYGKKQKQENGQLGMDL